MKRPPISESRDLDYESGPGLPASSWPFLRKALEREGEPVRKPQQQTLTSAAHAWLTHVPPRYQPLATARGFAHVVNRLAELWGEPTALPTYFDELLMSTRRGRRGFPFEVLIELSDLQTWFTEERARLERAALPDEG